MVEGRVGAGFQAMAAGNWCGARDAFSAVLEVAEVPEAIFGLANALFWLGDIADTIANCEKAYVGFRRRGDPMFAAGAALSLVGYKRGTSGTRLRAVVGCSVPRGSLTARFRSCAGSSSGLPPM